MTATAMDELRAQGQQVTGLARSHASAEALESKGVRVRRGDLDDLDVQDHFGWIGTFFGMEMSATSTATRELLGWTPTGPTLVEDLDAGAYSARTPVAR